MKADIEIPSIYALYGSLPDSVRQKYGDSLFKEVAAHYGIELSGLLGAAERCRGEAVVRMGTFSGDPDGQIIAEFFCNDLAKPDDPNQVNWHGQNVSRWMTAGCILVDGRDGKVSTHH